MICLGLWWLPLALWGSGCDLPRCKQDRSKCCHIRGMVLGKGSPVCASTFPLDTVNTGAASLELCFVVRPP